MKREGHLSIIIFAAAAALFFCSSNKTFASENHLLISEIYSHPLSGENEYIEIYNPTEASIDLSTFSIEDGTHKPKTLSGLLSPGCFYFVEKTSGGFNFALNDSGDTVILRQSEIAIDIVSYGDWDDGTNNPDDNASAPTLGKTISRYPVNIDTDITKYDFVLSVKNPGADYVKPAYTDLIKINEVVPEPTNGSANEFIELKNTGQVQIDLAGWVLDDIEGGSIPYIIPDGITIDPEAYLVFYQTNTLIALNDSGDSVRLLDPNGEINDSVSYIPAKRGQSFSRFDNSWMWTTVLTPITENIYQTEVSAAEEDPSVIIKLAEAKKVPDGTTVQVAGQVTILPGILSSQSFYIQDSSGGLQIYCYDKCFPSLAKGQLIQVLGEISSYYGERRLKIAKESDIVIIADSKEIIAVEEKQISQIVDEDVGRIIQTEGIISQTSGDNFVIVDGEELAVIIRKSTGIDKPRMNKGQRVRVIGVISSYRGEIRLLPFEQSGVTILTSGNLPVTGAEIMEKNMEHISYSPEETAEIISLLAANFVGGDVLALKGDLGSGKTTSVKAIAKYFGVVQEITSPTFVIMKNYKLPRKTQGISEIVHVDAYRLHGAPDAESIGLSEYFQRNDVLIIIEWPENISNIIPSASKSILFEYLDNNQRKISSNFA